MESKCPFSVFIINNYLYVPLNYSKIRIKQRVFVVIDHAFFRKVFLRVLLPVASKLLYLGGFLLTADIEPKVGFMKSIKLEPKIEVQYYEKPYLIRPQMSARDHLYLWSELEKTMHPLPYFVILFLLLLLSFFFVDLFQTKVYALFSRHFLSFFFSKIQILGLIIFFPNKLFA